MDMMDVNFLLGQNSPPGNFGPDSNFRKAVYNTPGAIYSGMDRASRLKATKKNNSVFSLPLPFDHGIHKCSELAAEPATFNEADHSFCPCFMVCLCPTKSCRVRATAQASRSNSVGKLAGWLASCLANWIGYCMDSKLLLSKTILCIFLAT
jgi:hypothetical protein